MFMIRYPDSGCLAGMDYRMDGVQLTCYDFSSVDNCSNTTSTSGGTPGCFCSNGNVLEDGVCIPPGECPSEYIYAHETLMRKRLLIMMEL